MSDQLVRPTDANRDLQSRRHDQARTRQRPRWGDERDSRGCRHLESRSSRSKTSSDQGRKGIDGAGEGCTRKHGNFGGQADGLSGMIGHVPEVLTNADHRNAPESILHMDKISSSPAITIHTRCAAHH